MTNGQNYIRKSNKETVNWDMIRLMTENECGNTFTWPKLPRSQKDIGFWREGGRGMMIFFSKIFLGLYKYSRNTVKKNTIWKKIVLFWNWRYTISKNFLPQDRFHLNLKKQNFSFKNLRPGHLGSNNYY